MDYKQALVLAELIDKLVTANIEYLNNYQVRIEHLDGSKMFYKFACSFFLDEEYALIITEHVDCFFEYPFYFFNFRKLK